MDALFRRRLLLILKLTVQQTQPGGGKVGFFRQLFHTVGGYGLSQRGHLVDGNADLFRLLPSVLRQHLLLNAPQLPRRRWDDLLVFMGPADQIVDMFRLLLFNFLLFGGTSCPHKQYYTKYNNHKY